MHDTNEAIKHSNQKSTKTCSTNLIEHVTKETINGYHFTFHPQDMHRMRGVVVAPQIMVVQSVLENFVRSIPKHRPAHDKSFSFSESNAINDCLDYHSVPLLLYGFCLNRIFHGINSLSFYEPTNPIIISKIDSESAYSRGSMSVSLEMKRIALLCGFAFLVSYLPFGSSNCPSLWCTTS